MAEKATKTNCTSPDGHRFALVRDEKKKRELRDQFPEFIAPVWECLRCKKVTESS